MVNGLIRGEIMAKSATAEIRSSEATGSGCRAAAEMAIDAPYEKPINVIDSMGSRCSRSFATAAVSWCSMSAWYSPVLFADGFAFD